MPDHLHLFVAIDDQRINLSDWMKSLKGVVSANLRAAKKQPPYWQKGFFDHVLRSSDSYAAKWNYVRENPVRAGLVSHRRNGLILDMWTRLNILPLVSVFVRQSKRVYTTL